MSSALLELVGTVGGWLVKCVCVGGGGGGVGKVGVGW